MSSFPLSSNLARSFLPSSDSVHLEEQSAKSGDLFSLSRQRSLPQQLAELHGKLGEIFKREISSIDASSKSDFLQCGPIINEALSRNETNEGDQDQFLDGTRISFRGERGTNTKDIDSSHLCVRLYDDPASTAHTCSAHFAFSVVVLGTIAACRLILSPGESGERGEGDETLIEKSRRKSTWQQQQREMRGMAGWILPCSSSYNSPILPTRMTADACLRCSAMCRWRIQRFRSCRMPSPIKGN